MKQRTNYKILKKNKISKNWIKKHKKDQFVKKSKSLGFRSRSAFKLIEMNQKFNFIHKNTFLLDLGSSPGGWSQVAAKRITNGKILAIDIKSMENIQSVKFFRNDIYDIEINKKILFYFKKNIDVVISDMASNTTGNKDMDTYRTGELCLTAMNLAKKVLNQKGVFLSKIFMGSIFSEIKEKANKTFQQVVQYKPLSSKKESREIYIYCKGVL